MSAYQNFPRHYADVNLKQNLGYYDYESLQINWGQQDHYEILQKIGRGKYSEVFEAINMKTQQECVLKILKPIRKKKIRREIKILQNLAKGQNIIQLYDIIKDPSTRTTTLVLEYVRNRQFKELITTFTETEVRFYMYQLLKGINFCHSKGIMHRDIKPNNILINLQNKVLKIIDFGLAEFYFPGKEYNTKVNSRFTKAPELLVNFQYYDYSVDMWSFGIILASAIFQRDPFFQGFDEYDQLEKITRILGTKELFDYLEKYQIVLDVQYEGYLGKNQKKSFNKLITNENKHLATNDALDLLSKLLVYDHSERLTSLEALKHPYFKQQVQEEQQQQQQTNQAQHQQQPQHQPQEKPQQEKKKNKKNKN